MPVYVQDGNPISMNHSRGLIRRSLSLEDDKNVGIPSSIPSMDGHRKRLKENLMASQRSSSYAAPAAPALFVTHSNMSQFHGNIANTANGITGLPYGPPSMSIIPSRSSRSSHSNALIPTASPTISIQMHPLQDNFINETMKRLRQVEMDRVTNAKRRKVVLWNGDNSAAVPSLASANDANIANNANGANNSNAEIMKLAPFANAENVKPALSQTIKEQGSNANNANHASLKKGSFRSFLRSADERKPIPILEEMSRHSDVPQIVATSGGLITYRNEPFSNITQPIIPSSSSPLPSHCASSEANPNSPPSSNACKRSNGGRRAPRPLTIFELIDPHSLPNLYGMLALALHDVGIVEVEGHDSREKSVKNEKSERPKEDGRAASSSSSVSASVSASSTVASSAPSSDHVPSGTNIGESPPPSSTGASSVSISNNNNSSHLAITLPCKSFERHLTKSRYNITIIFLNDPDLAPIKRCFLGILTASTTAAVVRYDECTAANRGNLLEGNEKRPAMPVGKIFRTEDERLCRFLLGSSHSRESSHSVTEEQL